MTRIQLSSQIAGEPPSFRLLAVMVPEKADAAPAWTQKLPADLQAALRAALSAPGFSAKLGETSLVHSAGGASILVGMGTGTPTGETVRRAFAVLMQAAGKAKQLHVTAPLPSGRDARSVAENAVVGALLGNYRFSTYHSDSTKSKHSPPVETLILWEPNGARRREAARGLASGDVLAEATNRVRDLANTPANDLPPAALAKVASGWCQEAGVKLQVLGPSEIERAGMRAVLAVGGGSVHEPRFLIASYHGRKRRVAGARKRTPQAVDVALVGKGVTFDSGGITLKPGADMWEMRGDMTGSAVMLAAICAAAKLRLPLDLVALTPLVENMPSGAAYRPGDVIRMLSGLTVEIISTDAEGRLILADALTYAQRYNPRVIVDCATLTGAIRVALGEVRCGVFTEHDVLWRAMDQCARATGEKAWRMPLDEEYDEVIRSEIADMRNSGKQYGGASVAARLLRKFTGDYPWLHIDIAGVDVEDKGQALCPKGATGFGARLVIEWLRSRR
ncbi:MAG: leucyl aminopeptidase [Candidatus Zixiibacteriota bacterium]